MNPVEFVLWMNGAAELVGDQPPTPEQWAIMRGKLGEAVGGLVAARLLERAEETLRADERRNEAVKQAMALGLYQSQARANAMQGELEAQRRRNLANAPSLGIISGVPELPTLELPELPTLGKVTT